MDTRTGIGLGQDQCVVQAAGGVEAFRGQALDRARDHRVLAAHQAQAGAVLGDQHFFLALLLHLVFAVAKEGEVVVGGPAQEFLCFQTRGLAHRQRTLAQVIGQRQCLVGHRLPVLDDGAHVVQRIADALGNNVEVGGGLAVDLQQHHRFQRAATHARQLASLVARDADDRMAQHVHADALLGQCQRHRVHQERHVVVDDLQHGVARLPTIGLQGRVENAHIRLARLAGTRELQHASGQYGPIVSRVLRELVRFHALVERRGECNRLRLRRSCGITLPQGCKNRFEREAGLHGVLLYDSRFGFGFCRLGSVVLRFHDRAWVLLVGENAIVSLATKSALLQDGNIARGDDEKPLYCAESGTDHRGSMSAT
ncbi:hypothetical protein D3C71_1150670 [compost metagenome]